MFYKILKKLIFSLTKFVKCIKIFLLKKEGGEGGKMGRSKFFNEKKILCINVEKEEKEEIERVAKEYGMEVSSFIRWVLKKEIKKKEKEAFEW
ncbi:hypothetical protein J7K86_01305 [bacterium]|nr:hypothetical protein [bacterium]